MRKILWILFLGSVGCTEPVAEKSEETDLKRKINSEDLRLTDLKGAKVNLAEFKGKTVFVNFWATWCRPCIEEMPSIQRAQEELSKDGVVFLLASDEEVDDIRAFENHRKYDLRYLRLMNPGELNIGTLPTTYIFNSKGELVFSEVGSRKWSDSGNIKMIAKINDSK